MIHALRARICPCGANLLPKPLRDLEKVPKWTLCAQRGVYHLGQVTHGSVTYMYRSLVT